MDFATAPKNGETIKINYQTTETYTKYTPNLPTPKNVTAYTPDYYLRVATMTIGANASTEEKTIHAYDYYNGGPVSAVTTKGYNNDAGDEKTRMVQLVRDQLYRVGEVKLADNNQPPSSPFYKAIPALNNLVKAESYAYHSQYGYLQFARTHAGTSAVVHEAHLAYDSLGRPTSESLTIGSSGTARIVTISGWDKLNRIGSIQYPDGGTTLAFGYGSGATASKLGRIKTMTVDGNALAEYTYVGLGRVRTRKVYNTPGTTTLHSDLRVNYLANARVVHQYLNTMTGGPQTNIAKYEYGYDNVYNQTSKKDLLAPSGQQYEAYNYDNLYRLTGVKYGANASATTYDRSTVFNLDIVGNREGTSGVVEDADGSGSGTPVSIPYASNEVNEYNTAGSANPLHDAYGNLTFDGANTYTFDHNDRLKTVNGTGIEYDYDALGRRLTKTVGSITTRYYYSGWRCIQERNAADVIVAEYIHGNNIDEVLQMKRGGCTYTYHTDAQGNVVAISDATGKVIEKIKYDVYGRITKFEYWDPTGGGSGAYVEAPKTGGFVTAATYYTCSLTKNPYLFQGRRLDEESGLYYFRNRYYDPTHGRFISRDPEGFVDGPNLYAFVNNNPINYVDPLGLEYKAIYDKSTGVLKKGRKGLPVRKLQQVLIREGLLSETYINSRGEEKNSADSDFGKRTEAAVKAFQRKLIEKGFLSKTYTNRAGVEVASDDGQWGRLTEKAYRAYFEDKEAKFNFVVERLLKMASLDSEIKQLTLKFDAYSKINNEFLDAYDKLLGPGELKWWLIPIGAENPMTILKTATNNSSSAFKYLKENQGPHEKIAFDAAEILVNLEGKVSFISTAWSIARQIKSPKRGGWVKVAIGYLVTKDAEAIMHIVAYKGAEGIARQARIQMAKCGGDILEKRKEYKKLQSELFELAIQD